MIEWVCKDFGNKLVGICGFLALHVDGFGWRLLSEEVVGVVVVRRWEQVGEKVEKMGGTVWRRNQLLDDVCGIFT